MNREKLNSYRSTVRLIEKDRRRLRNLESNKPSAVFGKAKGSSVNFPFTERSFSVCGAYEQSGMSEKEYYAKLQNLKCSIENSIRDSEIEKMEVEEFIQTIDNKLHKEIFIGLYIDGLKQEELAKEVNMERSNIPKIVSKYVS